MGSNDSNGASQTKLGVHVGPKTPLRDSMGREFYLVTFAGDIPNDYQVVSLWNEEHAKQYLRTLIEGHFNLQAMRNLVLTRLGSTATVTMDAEATIGVVARWLSSGSMRLLRAPPPPKLLIPEAAPEEEPRPPPPRKSASGMLSILVIDDRTEEPVPKVKMRLKLPGGDEQDAVTDSSGRIDISTATRGFAQVVATENKASLKTSIAYVGTGMLSSQPQAGQSRGNSTSSSSGGQQQDLVLRRIVEHKVKTGDTLASVANLFGLTWEQLAQFNWETTAPDEINKRLFREVGCRKKTQDKKNYVFDSADKPGIVYGPRLLLLSAFALDQLHILRVGKLPRPKPFLFSM